MITVARITRRKGHHLTLAALSQLPENLRRRITWLVIGPGSTGGNACTRPLFPIKTMTGNDV
jgi:hypothetical protein